MAPTPETYTCDECGKICKNKTALIAHITYKHENPPQTQCLICDKVFSRRSNLKKHMNSTSHTIHNKKAPPKTIKCPLNCDFFTVGKDNISKHYSDYHGKNLKVKNINFKKMENFFEWKRKFEEDTGSHFINAKGNIERKTGTIVYYICHRDGFYKAEGNNLRIVKLQGTNKINSHCPAKITCRINESNVYVEYIDTHIGHEMEINRINISKSEKKEIRKKLEAKVSFDEILRNSGGRDDKLTRKHLWNFVDSFKLNHDTFRIRKKRKNVQNNESSIENEQLVEEDSLYNQQNTDIVWENVEQLPKVENERPFIQNPEIVWIKNENTEENKNDGDGLCIVIVDCPPNENPEWDKSIHVQELVNKVTNVAGLIENEEQFTICMNQVGTLEHEIKMKEDPLSLLEKPIPDLALIQEDTCSKFLQPSTRRRINKRYFTSSAKIKKKYFKF